MGVGGCGGWDPVITGCPHHPPAQSFRAVGVDGAGWAFHRSASSSLLQTLLIFSYYVLATVDASGFSVSGSNNGKPDREISYFLCFKLFHLYRFFLVPNSF
jgi:hypothetical protein